MTRFGWYYEEGLVRDDGHDLWALVGEAVEEAAGDDRLHLLRVGEMCGLSVGNLISDEDVVSLADNRKLRAEHVVDHVSDRCGELVFDGHARLLCSQREAEESLRDVLSRFPDTRSAAPHVVEWARTHIELDPSSYCNGSDPLPIEYVEGEWVFGGTEAESAAVITYATEPSPETGHVGWVWWALGKMGDAPTLTAAREAAETVVRKELGL